MECANSVILNLQTIVKLLNCRAIMLDSVIRASLVIRRKYKVVYSRHTLPKCPTCNDKFDNYRLVGIIARRERINLTNTLTVVNPDYVNDCTVFIMVQSGPICTCKT